MNRHTDHALHDRLETTTVVPLISGGRLVPPKSILVSTRIAVIVKCRLRRDLRISLPAVPKMDNELKNQVKARVLKRQSEVAVTMSIPPPECINVVIVNESATAVIDNPDSYEGVKIAYILMQIVSKNSTKVARFEMTEEQLIAYMCFYCPAADVPASVRSKGDLREHFINHVCNNVVSSTKIDVRGVFESEERLSKMIDSRWALHSQSVPSQSVLMDSAKLRSTDNPADTINRKPVGKLAPESSALASLSKLTDSAEDTHNVTRTGSSTFPSASRTDASTLADSASANDGPFILQGIRLDARQLVSKRTTDQLANEAFPDRKAIMKILAEEENDRGIACDATAALDQMLRFILGAPSEGLNLSEKIKEFGEVGDEVSPVKNRIRLWRNGLVHPKQLNPRFEALDTDKATFLSLCETTFTFLSTLWKKEQEIEYESLHEEC
jgi:hypothetical protein